MAEQSDKVECVRDHLESAIGELLHHDADLLRLDVNERSITHRLAGYLQTRFPTWDVDCEYNRNHDQVKRLSFEGECVRNDDTDAKTVFPDIIVHHRDTDYNLLVVEVKKTSNRDGDKRDCEKLTLFRDVYHYEHAAFVKLHTGDHQLRAEPIRWL